MKKIYLWLYALLLSGPLFAQTDSITVYQADWATKKLTREVTWKTVHFGNKELFGSNQNINLVLIKPHASRVKLVVGYSDSLETTSQQAVKAQAIAGINGSFFQMRGADPDDHPGLKGVPKREPAKLDHNRSIDYLREDGKLIAPNQVAGQSARKRYQQGVVALSDTGIAILRPDSANFDWESKLSARDVMTSGPLLLLNGQYASIPHDAFSENRHPRTAVGKKADGTIVLLVADGRAEQAAGMSLRELQQTMRWLGCTIAINLDGGGSSTMYIKGEPENGVVNYPTDNKKFDHAGEREVANTLLVVPVQH